MKEQSIDDRERINKLNEAALYNVGYEHANNVCDEIDQLLEEYKDIKVPESLNEWFGEYEKENNKKIRSMANRKKVLQISKRVAMILLVVIVTFSAITMSVEAYRIRFFNMIIEVQKKFSSMKFEESNNIEYINELPKDWKDFFYPMRLPQGYLFKKAFQGNSIKYIIFSNNQMEEMYFVQGPITTDFQFDTEDSFVMEVDVNGMEGLIIEKEGRVIITWHNNDYSYYIQGHVDKSAILDMAESVIQK